MRRLGALAMVFALAGPAAAQVPDPDVAALVPSIVAPYAHALASIAAWGLLMLVLTMLSVIGTPRARTAGGLPVREYSDPYYRRSRAFANAVEATGPFLAVTLAAILVGAAPFWVNLLAAVFLVARVGAAAAHIGTEIEPLRSAFWAVGLLCTIALGLMAFVGAFSL